jgi:hypothetical protein
MQKAKDVELVTRVSLHRSSTRWFMRVVVSTQADPDALTHTLASKNYTPSGFKVTRLVIKPIPTRQEVTVFRLTQEVDKDGTVNEVESVPVSLPAADLLWLGFPSYL